MQMARNPAKKLHNLSSHFGIEEIQHTRIGFFSNEVNLIDQTSEFEKPNFSQETGNASENYSTAANVFEEKNSVECRELHLGSCYCCLLLLQ